MREAYRQSHRDVIARKTGPTPFRNGPLPGTIPSFKRADEHDTPGEFKLAGISTKARGAQFGGLIEGRRYAFRARAIGGSTGHSPWSMVVNQRVI